MDQTTTDKLNALLDFVKSGAEKTTDFAAEQAPLIAREIVAWQLWTSLVGIAFGLVMLFVVCVCLAVCIRNKWKEEPPVIICGIVGLILGIGVIPVICVNTHKTIKATVAPRLVVIDYLKSEVK